MWINGKWKEGNFVFKSENRVFPLKLRKDFRWNSRRGSFTNYVTQKTRNFDTPPSPSPFCHQVKSPLARPPPSPQKWRMRREIQNSSKIQFFSRFYPILKKYVTFFRGTTPSPLLEIVIFLTKPPLPCLGDVISESPLVSDFLNEPIFPFRCSAGKC